MEKRNILIVFVIALLLRLIVIPNPGFEADVSFWKSWGLAQRDLGIIEGLKATNNNYPTPFAYTLGAMVSLYSIFADPHTFNEFWKNTNLLFLFISKLPPIIADFGIAAVILWLGKHAKRIGIPPVTPTFYVILAAIYLLSPISLIDGAWWGQVDSLGVVLFLLAVVVALKNKSALSGAIFMLAMMTKLQNMIYGPLFFLFIYQLHGYPGLVRAIAGSTLAFFGLNIEFLLAGSMSRVVTSLVDNYDYFPWMSLNAFNLWWIVARGQGMGVSDKLLAIGITNAKTVGLLIFSSFYLFGVLRQLFDKKHVLEAFLTSLVIVNGAFFLFQTQSHDRYAFPLSVFLLLLAPFYIKHIRGFLVLYGAYTLVYFYNLHTALVYNYPHNGLPILTSLTQTPVTIVASIILLLLFFVFLVYVARQSKWFVWTIPIAVLFLGLIAKNMPLITKQPVNLTAFTPYIHTQSYKSFVNNMPVNANLGWKSQQFLSVQYAFYRKGIGTHAASRMDFDLGGKFRRFSTDMGIDTSAGPAGSAIFEIYGDDRLLYSSGKIIRYELPRHADVDITGVRFLTLITTDAGDGITDDHTDWLNPTLWPK